MRPLGLALLALALTASPASAAVIELEEHYCGCDGSSGDEDSVGIVVRAAPGELNRMTVRQLPRGILIEDAGAPLTGRCRPSQSGGRFCRGAFDGVEVHLGDGDDRIQHDYNGLIDGGSGDDDILGTGGPFRLIGGPGADRLEATGISGSSVSYLDHTEGVAVRLNGRADDGTPGEGDNVLGAITGIGGGAGDDYLEAGPTASGLSGEGGDDILVGSPEHDSVHGGDGDDELLAGDGNDYLTGAGGADVLSGGGGLDEVSYGGTEPLHLSIGDGANDGEAGEGDDIRGDVEGLTGGRGDDVLIGDDDPNRLIAYGGRDVLRGGGGADQLIGWNDGDELDAGSGPDLVEGGALDRPLLVDGEADRLNCRSRAPAIQADDMDVLRSCAPRVYMRLAARPRAGRPLALRAPCPVESTVPCEGRLWLHVRNGRRISRVVGFGPAEPGSRIRANVRRRAPVRRGACLYATTVTRRGDGLRTTTTTVSALFCLPR